MSETVINNDKTRFEWLDSIKGVLIFFIVLGHFIGSKVSPELNIITIVHYMTYSILMPVFLFISGFLSKRKSSFEKIFKNFIIPYAVFDIIYVVISRIMGGSGDFNILFPTYLYWYMLCIAFLRLSVDFMDKTKLAYLTPVISIAVCYFCPEHLWRFLSLGRVLLMFPVFYLGYKMDKKWLQFFREKKWISFLICAANIVFEFLLIKFNVVETSFAAHDYPVSIKDHIIKLINMFFALGAFTALCAIVPEKLKFLKRWGRNSLLIYLLHSYAVMLFGKILAKFSIDSVWLEFAICAAISLVVTEILSLNIFSDIYKKIFGCINKGFDFVKGKLIKS